MPANGARISDASPSAQVPVRTRALICPRNIWYETISVGYKIIPQFGDNFDMCAYQSGMKNAKLTCLKTSISCVRKYEYDRAT